MITMTHSGISGTARASLEAFEAIWEGLGWTLVDEGDTGSALPAGVHYCGEWSTSTYAPGDIVTVSGVEYIALQVNTNKAPASYPAFWEPLGGGGGGSGFVSITGGGKETVVTIADAGSAATLDLADGNVFEVRNPVASGTCTLTLTGATAGVECGCSIRFHQRSSGDSDLAFAGTVVAMNEGTLPGPVQAPNGVSTYALTTPDGGDTIYAWKTGDSEAEVTGLPGAPTAVSAVAGDAEATVSFTPPVDEGDSAIISYTVTSSPGAITATDTASPILVTGLTNDTAYTFTVHATNTQGDGPESTASATVTPAASAFVDPSSVTGLAFWYRADDIALADGSDVAAWVDRSPHGRDAAQTDATRRPIYKTAILNGHDVVRTDALADAFMATAAFALAQPDTIFVVGKVASSASAGGFLDGPTVQSHEVGQNTVNFTAYAGGGAEAAGGAVDTSPHVLCAVFNGASSRMRKDGGAGGGANIGGGTINGLTLLALGGPSFPLNGEIAEIVGYSGALSLADINAVGGYLATRYGLTWTTAT